MNPSGRLELHQQPRAPEARAPLLSYTQRKEAVPQGWAPPSGSIATRRPDGYRAKHTDSGSNAAARIWSSSSSPDVSARSTTERTCTSANELRSLVSHLWNGGIQHRSQWRESNPTFVRAKRTDQRASSATDR